MQIIKDFSMVSFTRIAWVSARARSTWELIISDCARLAQDLEVESVAAGQRRCAWRTVEREQLPKFSKSCTIAGLVVLPVQWVGRFDGFIHYTPPGDSQIYCIIAKNTEDARGFLEAYEKGDHEAQGDFLGFPKCCCLAFSENWKAGIFDPIWQAALQTKNEEIKEASPSVHPYSNPLLRYIGLRVGFHIPHSFNCEKTIENGRERLSLAKDRGLVRLLEHLLSMPMEATLLYGILQVRTPLFYVITYSVPTNKKYTISATGDFIPEEGQWQSKATQ